MMLRLAAALALAMSTFGCGLEVVELARGASEVTEIVVIGAVPKSAIDRFERTSTRVEMNALTLSHPEDNAAIPVDSAPIPFVWDSAKLKAPKPEPGEPKPEPPMPGAKPTKPTDAEAEMVYELHLRSDVHEARIYTKDTQVTLPENTWRNLLDGQRDRELRLSLRALSLAEPGKVLAAAPRKLAVRAAARAGRLYFRTQGPKPFARARFGDLRPEELDLECKQPALAVSGNGARLATRCEERTSVFELPSLTMSSSFASPKESEALSLDGDGKRVVRAYLNLIEIVSVEGALLSRLELEAGARAADAVFAPDGATIAFVYAEPGGMMMPANGPGSALALVRADSSGPLAAPTVLVAAESKETSVRFPHFSPDGQLLAYARGKGDVAKLDQAALEFAAASTGEVRPYGMPMLEKRGPAQPVWIPSEQPGAYWIVYAAARDVFPARPGDRPLLWASLLELGSDGVLALRAPFLLPFQDVMRENAEPAWAPEPAL